MQFNFEKLNIWHQGREFCSDIYQVTENFPQRERFSLVDQLNRAAISIVLNIAEGSNRGSKPDFIRFLRIAQGSICEVVTGLYLSLDRKYINQSQFDPLYQKAIALSSRITATIKSLKQ